MSRRAVAIVIHDGVQALDVAGPLDVFAEANEFLPHTDSYDLRIVAAEARSIRTSNGLAITADMDFSEASLCFDTVLVAGGRSLPTRPRDASMKSWLCDWATRAERYGSICTGAFVLGQAGLLDGRCATTHWERAHQLAAMFPRARVEHDRTYVRDGPLMTSAGVSAGIDLALALVAEDHGERIALSCAKRLLFTMPHQRDAAQSSPHLSACPSAQSPLSRVTAYILQNLHEALPVDRLAEIAGVSARSLARLFAAELGVTPHEFVESARMDKARSLLQATDVALKILAYHCGFGGAEQMRVVFQRRLGVSPAAYRSGFRSPVQASGNNALLPSAG